MSKFIHYMDTGPVPAYVGFTSNPKNFARELARLKVKDPQNALCADADNPGRTTTLERSNENILCIVSMDRGRAKNTSVPAIAGLLAHEATHVKQKVMAFMRESEPSPEFEAYFIQSVTQFCLSEWLKGR